MYNQEDMNNETEVSGLSGDYEVAPVATAEEREAVFAIRMTVFVEEQAVPPEEELDLYDLTALHFLVRRKGAPPDDPTGIVATRPPGGQGRRSGQSRKGRRSPGTPGQRGGGVADALCGGDRADP